jgi:hypothetical protein
VCGVAFFQERVAEKKSFVVIGSDDFFVLQEVDGEVGVRDAAVIIEVGIGMVAYLVAGLVPRGEELGTVIFVDAHAADEESGFDVAAVESFQDAGVGFGPAEVGVEFQVWVVHGDGELGARSTGAARRSGGWTLVRLGHTKSVGENRTAGSGRKRFERCVEKFAAIHGQHLRKKNLAKYGRERKEMFEMKMRLVG